MIDLTSKHAWKIVRRTETGKLISLTFNEDNENCVEYKQNEYVTQNTNGEGLFVFHKLPTAWCCHRAYKSQTNRFYTYELWSVEVTNPKDFVGIYDNVWVCDKVKLIKQRRWKPWDFIYGF